MALQLSKATHFGFTMTEAYARVAYIQNTKDNGIATVEYYYDGASRINGCPPVQVEEIVVSVAGGANVPDCYVYLKTLDQFAGALDV